MSYKSELIRKLFSNRLKKDELKDLSEIDMIERKMKVQWEEQNPIAENSERVDPEIGDYIWAKSQFDSSIIRWQQPVWL